MSYVGLQLGHYELQQRIKSGGMGEIYLGIDTRVSRQVVIKIVITDLSAQPDPAVAKEIARAKREIKTISQLNHQHIVPLFDFGEQRDQDTLLTYMVMPYYPAGSLDDWLRTSGKTTLSPQEVASFIDQAADALECAHNHHIVHQDVKPSNFLVNTKTSLLGLPDLQLADFGIARFTTATTTASQSIGTPSYMPPEQWNAKPVHASDQYALAIMAFQLLTGYLPFKGTIPEVMQKHFNTPPPSPNISPDIDAVLLRALAKAPHQRFPSITAFAQAFRKAVEKSTSPVVQLPVTVPARPRPVSPKNAVQLLLVILLLVGSTFGVVSFGIPAIQRFVAANNLHATATSVAATQTQGAQASRTTGLAAATGTARAKATATASTSAVAATGTARSATATASVSPSATPAPGAYPTPTYIIMPGKGTLVLNDPLQNNNKGYGWSSSASCRFAFGTYHASTSGRFAYCNASGSGVSHLSNTIIEVKMTITQGDCGGIIFRANLATGSYYAFEVCQDGTYTLSPYANNQGQPMISNPSTSIKKGLNQANTLDVVANGSELAFYINGQQVPGTTDTTYTGGEIGVLADAMHGHSTDVAYSNVKVWTIA